MNVHKNNLWIKEQIFISGMIMSYTTLHTPYKAENVTKQLPKPGARSWLVN